MKTFFYTSSPRRTSSTPDSCPSTTFSDKIVDDNIRTVQSILDRWKPMLSNRDSFFLSSLPLFSSNNRNEAEEYIQMVHMLQGTMRYVNSVNRSSKRLIEAQMLMETAMDILRVEFHRILKTNQKYLDPEFISVHSSSISGLGSTSQDSASVSEDGQEDEFLQEYSTEKGPDTAAMDDLKTIADCMIPAGYAKECVKIYQTTRRSIVEEKLYDLGVERLALTQLRKMDCEFVEKKVKSWSSVVRYVVRILFHGERKLCDHVFSVSPSVGESCFTEIAKGALTLLDFPETVWKCKKMLTPDKIFHALDMYEAISVLLPEIEAIFSFDSTTAVRSQALVSLDKLGEVVRFMMDEFEAAIQKNTSKTPIPGGGVHHLTRYVMNYISVLSEYSEWLEYVFEGWKLKCPSSLPDISFGDEAKNDGVWSSPVTVRLAWLILLALCKVDGKAQLYDDTAQSYLFLANNHRYVVVKVRSSKLKQLLGEDWCQRHERKLTSYAASYEKLAWGNTMASLPDKELVRPNQVRDCFKRFNMAFESACKRQSGWVVTDQKLRDEIKSSVSRKLVQAYRGFYNRYSVELATRGMAIESVIKYAPEDLDNYLSDLFFGSSGLEKASSETLPSAGSSSPLQIMAKKFRGKKRL